MRRTLKTFTTLAAIAALAFTAMAAGHDRGGGTASEVGKANLCHFEEGHEAMSPYTDDRNGDDPGFWTVTAGSTYNDTGEDVYLVGDYIVRYDMSGDEYGLNSGQKALCTGNGGTFEQVSVNSLDGHDAQLNFDVVLDTYPEGWWK